MKKKLFLSFAIVSFLALNFGAESALAWENNWWNSGYKPPEWILAHGGTIIKYTITGTSHTNDYKAMMFRDGKYVEVEFGSGEAFDDAKDGTYVINFYKCKDSCMPHKTDNKQKIRSSDKKVASVSVIARGGETVTLVFDVSSGTVAFTSGQAGRPIDPFLAKKNLAKQHEGQQCSIVNTEEKKKVFIGAVLRNKNVNLDNVDKYVELGLLSESFSSKDDELVKATN